MDKLTTVSSGHQ